MPRLTTTKNKANLIGIRKLDGDVDQELDAFEDEQSCFTNKLGQQTFDHVIQVETWCTYTSIKRGNEEIKIIHVEWFSPTWFLAVAKADEGALVEASVMVCRCMKRMSRRMPHCSRPVTHDALKAIACFYNAHAAHLIHLGVLSAEDGKGISP